MKKTKSQTKELDSSRKKTEYCMKQDRNGSMKTRKKDPLREKNKSQTFHKKIRVYSSFRK